MKKTLLITTLFITGVCFGQTYDHIEFYDDGISPKVIKTYKESKGMLELVKAITWYENGQKWLEETYKDGKLAGKWVDWYENGEKVSEETFKDGEVISEKCWDEDGYERECYSMKRLWLK